MQVLLAPAPRLPQALRLGALGPEEERAEVAEPATYASRRLQRVDRSVWRRASLSAAAEAPLPLTQLAI